MKPLKFSASLQPNELAGADQATALIDSIINGLTSICREVLVKSPRADDLFLTVLVQKAFKASCVANGHPEVAGTVIPIMVARLVVRLIRAEDRLKENQK